MEQYLKTVAEVTALVQKIRDQADDYERAHSREDDLHHSVLASIANGHAEDPAGMAREALKTLEISFERYCA